MLFRVLFGYEDENKIAVKAKGAGRLEQVRTQLRDDDIAYIALRVIQTEGPHSSLKKKNQIYSAYTTAFNGILVGAVNLLCRRLRHNEVPLHLLGRTSGEGHAESEVLPSSPASLQLHQRALLSHMK